MNKKLRLVVCVPSTNSWEADFGMSMIMLMANFSQKIAGWDQQQLRVHNKKSSMLANSRQQMVTAALKQGATHLLFIDSDQTFPADLVPRLLAHEERVVACNVATKMLPPGPTARNKGGTHGVPIYTHPRSGGLEEVWRVGTGIMLIDMKVFKREPMKTGPWFTGRWHEELQMYRGEDWAFCERLQEAGIPIFIDHDVSKEVGHVGKLTYGHDMVELDFLDQKAS